MPSRIVKAPISEKMSYVPGTPLSARSLRGVIWVWYVDDGGLGFDVEVYSVGEDAPDLPWVFLNALSVDDSRLVMHAYMKPRLI